MKDKKFLRGVIAFLIAFLCFVLASVIIINFTFFSPQFMIKSFERNNYYDKSYADYLKELEYLAEPAGIDTDVLKQTVTLSEMKEDLQNTVRAAYSKDGAFIYDINKEKISARFFENLKTFVEEKGYPVERDLEKSLKYTASLATEQYVNHAKFIYVDMMGKVTNSFQGIVAIAFVAILILIIILGFVLYKVEEWKHRATRVLIYAFSSAALMLFVAPMFAIIYITRKNADIRENVLFNFTLGYTNNMLFYFVAFAALMLVISIFVFLFIYRRQLKRAA